MPSSLNGTGVTFNDNSTLQSGNIPAANLGSGTANSGTVLRGDRTWGAPPAPTTAQVLTATAGASVEAVGTYIFAIRSTASTGGTTYAGSSLNPSQSGTWRAMGNSVDLATAGFNTARVAVFLRIS